MGAERGKPATTGVRGVISNQEMDERIRALAAREAAQRAERATGPDGQVEPETTGGAA